MQISMVSNFQLRRLNVELLTGELFNQLVVWLLQYFYQHHTLALQQSIKSRCDFQDLRNIKCQC